MSTPVTFEEALAGDTVIVKFRGHEPRTTVLLAEGGCLYADSRAFRSRNGLVGKEIESYEITRRDLPDDGKVREYAVRWIDGRISRQSVSTTYEAATQWFSSDLDTIVFREVNPWQNVVAVS